LTDTAAGVFICDVLGHGLRAALVTAIVRGLLEELTAIAMDPGRVLSEINDGLMAIFRQTETPMLVSAFYLVVDTTEGKLCYASAGHPPPVPGEYGTGRGARHSRNRVCLRSYQRQGRKPKPASASRFAEISPSTHH